MNTKQAHPVAPLYQPAEARVGLYMRQSMYVEEGIDRQRVRTSQLAKSRDWLVVTEYEDNDVSASKSRGADTGWGRMLADLDAGRINMVVAVDLDRLLRSTADLNVLIQKGAKVVTVDGEIDLSTADGEFRATMLAGIARFETRRKSERQLRANEHRASKGLPFTAGARAFGYEKNGTVRPDEAAALRKSMEDYLAGKSARQIARDMAAAGFGTGRSGKPITADALHNMWENVRNIGQLRFRGEVVGDGAWEPIVSEELFYAVKAKRDGQKIGRRQGPRKNMLTGVCRCGQCGDLMRINYDRYGDRIYKCRNACVSRKADLLEGFISEVVLDGLKDREVRALLAQGDDVDVTPLRANVASLRERRAELVRMRMRGELDESEWLAGRKEVATLLDREQGRLDRALASKVAVPLLDSKDVAADWKALGQDGRREFIDRFLSIEVFSAGRGQKAGFGADHLHVEWTTGRAA